LQKGKLRVISESRDNFICVGSTKQNLPSSVVQKKRSSLYAGNLFKDLTEVQSGKPQVQLESKLTILKLSLLIDEDEPKLIKRRLRKTNTDTSELNTKTHDEMKELMKMQI
jgi:hypothetical protein